MELEKILKSIDKEINFKIERGQNFNTDNIIENYKLDENAAPIIKNYLNNVKSLYDKIFEKFDESNSKMRKYCKNTGKIISSFAGAGIGTVTCYMTKNPEYIKIFASTGAIIAFTTESIIHPTATMLLYQKAILEINKTKKPREKYRKETLQELKKYNSKS